MTGPSGLKIFQPDGGCRKCGGQHIKWQCAQWLDEQAAYGDDRGKKAIKKANDMMKQYGGELRVEA